jgi:hypothetical protein
MVSFNPEMKTSEMQALSQKLDMPCLFAMNSDRARWGDSTGLDSCIPTENHPPTRQKHNALAICADNLIRFCAILKLKPLRKASSLGEETFLSRASFPIDSL